MRRRDVITLIGSAATWPLAARAQPSMPVVGLLSSASSNDYAQMIASFRKGLNDAGYVEGRNVAIKYLWADDQYDRLPVLAAEFVRRQVAVIVAATTPAALAAKPATSAIPVVFAIGGDPVRADLSTVSAGPAGILPARPI